MYTLVNRFVNIIRHLKFKSFVKRCYPKIHNLSIIHHFAPKTIPFLPMLTPPIVQTINFNMRNDIEENIAHLMTLAHIALTHGETERAEHILLLALQISEEYQNYFAIPYIYDVLIAIAYTQNDYIKTVKIVVEAIEKLIQIGVNEHSNRLIDFKLRLARIYSNSNEINQAEIGFKSCLQHQRRKLLKGDTGTETGMLYVNILYWFGYHKINQNELDEAKTYIQTAYNYSHKIKSLSAYQEMVILYTMADLNMKLHDYNEALTNMQNALILAKGIGSVDLPNCYVRLGKIYIALKTWENARLTLEEGLKLAELFNEKDVSTEAKQLLEKLDTFSRN